MPSKPLMTVAESAARDFTHKLKIDTAESHRLLEQCKLSQQLMHPSVTVTDYADYLLALSSVQEFTENIIFPIAAPVVSDLPQRIKYQILLNNIAALPIDNISNFAHVYQPASENLNMQYALAHIYVMEGSTLGGKIIGRHIFECLGIDATSSTSYFNCYGDLTGKMWKSFLEPFAAYAITNQAEAEIIEAANKIFSSLSKHFEKSLDR